jgi:hypothetical protein
MALARACLEERALSSGGRGGVPGWIELPAAGWRQLHGLDGGWKRELYEFVSLWTLAHIGGPCAHGERPRQKATESLWPRAARCSILLAGSREWGVGSSERREQNKEGGGVCWGAGAHGAGWRAGAGPGDRRGVAPAPEVAVGKTKTGRPTGPDRTPTYPVVWP